MHHSDLLSISSFAHVSGIARKTLIFYDRIGLFKPAIIADNGYRYYHRNQLDIIGVIQALKDLGMPLEEIKKHLETRTPSRTLELLRKQEQVIKQEILKLRGVENMIFQRAASIELAMSIDTDTNRIQIIKQGAIPLMLSNPVYYPKNSISDDLWIQFQSQLLAENIPLGYPNGVVIPCDDMRNQNGDMISHMFVRLKTALYKQDYMPESYYLVCYAHADYGETEKIYPQIFDYIDKHKLTVIGNAYEEYLLDEVTICNPEEYLVRVMVQIQEP